ncbi:hypothetical protein [Aliarcobacter butzleri]|uniref:hypothetical protein n=1 Tax=Aliarcobacter butzleri TaxID=28197 RepID=UPI0024469E5C|nr:hypothetical protein [Aliarcobacter butzleri]MDH1975478.1 hypothetical protein [Aliarcobacter butzleri]
METTEKIEIDLNETHTKSFNSNDLIQLNAKNKFLTLIGNLLEDTENNMNYLDNEFLRVHNTILINGKRGMGKTSFILSMLKNNDLLRKEIFPLGIIDPTLIETKEHVFLNIITLIKDKVEESSNVRNNEYFKDWKNSLIKLASGLSMLEDIGSNHLHDSMWDSPELILEKGISNSKQGKELERNFHNFIDKSLNLLRKKAFFLVLDDIDTSLDRGIKILETLRKYLTSPKLIISILGDIDLYSILTRQLQWEKIDPKKILKDYEDGNKKYISQIEHLEEQYLTKILKPENRIDLQNLFDLKDSINIKIFDKEKKSKDSFNIESLNKFLEDLVNNIYLTNNNSYKKYYIETILTQSTRSILQILKLYNKQKGNIKINNFPEILKHTFYTTLKKKLESFNLLEIYNKDQYLNLLSIYIIKKNISRDNHLKLIPDFVDIDDNITMLYLNAISNNILVDSKNYLEYFIKVGYSLEQFMNLENKDERETKRFLEHIAIDSGESSSKIAKRLLSTSKINRFTPSNFILFGANFLSNKNLEKINNLNFLPLIISKVNRINKGNSYNFISFFNLLGFISDITKTNSIDEIKTKKIIYSQILEFTLFNDDIIKEDKDFIYEDNIQNTLIFDENEVFNWINKKNIIIDIPLFVLSKIWVRISYTFNNILKNKNTFNTYFDIFEMFIVGFLNAIFVEISLYKNENFDNKNFIKNPEKATSYYEKIDNYKVNEESYTLFDYLFECPFLKISNFDNLQEIIIEKEELKEEPKINFGKVEKEKQKKIILDNNLKELSALTIANRLRKLNYYNISNKFISELLKEFEE